MATSSSKYLRRRIPDGSESAAIKAYTELAGEVIWAWTDLHKEYALLFYKLFPESSSHYALILWNAVVADSTQRDMIRGLLLEGVKASPRQAKALLWAIKKTNELAKYRNDTAHGAIGYKMTHRGVVPRFSYFGNPMGRVLRHHERGVSVTVFLRQLIGDLLQISGYVGQIARMIDPMIDGPIPWPHRPQLRLLPTPKRKGVGRRSKSPKRDNRRKSSPE